MKFQSWKPEDLPVQYKDKYLITPTGEEGFYSLRERFKVVCLKCNKVVHENTTGPNEVIEMHEMGGCK